MRLKPVDDDAAEAPSVVRLKNREIEARDREEKPVRLGAAELDQGVPSRRLDLPSREDIELRTHQPGIEVLIEPESANQELVEENWGEATLRRNPIPWGWFALIGLAIVGAVAWSLSQVEEADEQLIQIREETQMVLVDDEQEEREAAQLVDRIDRLLRSYFDATSVEGLARKVRHPDRIVPLMKDYYADQPVFSARVKAIKVLQPLTLDNYGNFWMAAVLLGNGETHNLVIEIDADGQPLVDWETYVCYQPMDWDEFAGKRPAGRSLDFRVYVESDSFFSHEFADSKQWASFRLTALDAEETLFGYARVGSEEAMVLDAIVTRKQMARVPLILRLGIPEGLASRRGVVIEKVVNQRWLFLNSPDTNP